MFQNVIRTFAILIHVVAVVDIVTVGAAGDFRTTIGIWRQNGTAATLAEGQGVMAKANERMTMWCNSTQPWKACTWVWKKKAEELVRAIPKTFIY
jgi:hypothetical protein